MTIKTKQADGHQQMRAKRNVRQRRPSRGLKLRLHVRVLITRGPIFKRLNHNATNTLILIFKSQRN